MNPEIFVKQSVLNMKPSGIRKYFDLLNEMDDVISLGIGEPDFVTPWSIREAGIHSIESGKTHYASNAGLIELRREISKHLKKRYNLSYDAKDEILVTVGASESIDLPLRAILNKDDEVIVPEPCFVAYRGCIDSCGGKAVTLELKEENEFKIVKEDLLKVITDKTKAIVIAFPNNPTGAIMTRSELAEIVDVLKDRDILVLSDEIYSELNYEEKQASIASFESMKDKVIYINGFSKSYAMTGWRLGYVCGHKDIIKHMKKIHQFTLMCAPTVSQYAGIEALKNCQKDVNKMTNEYNMRRRYMYKGFTDIGLKCFEPKGAFYFFPNITSTGLSSDEFCERLLNEQKVLMIPGTAFGDCGEGFVRATYASSMENIKEALKRTSQFMKGLNIK